MRRIFPFILILLVGCAKSSPSTCLGNATGTIPGKAGIVPTETVTPSQIPQSEVRIISIDGTISPYSLIYNPSIWSTDDTFFSYAAWKKYPLPEGSIYLSVLKNLILPGCWLTRGFGHSSTGREIRSSIYLGGINWDVLGTYPNPPSCKMEIAYISRAQGLVFGIGYFPKLSDEQCGYSAERCKVMGEEVIDTLRENGDPFPREAVNPTITPRSFGECRGAPWSYTWTGDTIYLLRDTPLLPEPENSYSASAVILSKTDPHNTYPEDNMKSRSFFVLSGPICGQYLDSNVVYWQVKEDTEFCTNCIGAECNTCAYGWIPEADGDGQYFEKNELQT